MCEKVNIITNENVQRRANETLNFLTNTLAQCSANLYKDIILDALSL